MQAIEPKWMKTGWRIASIFLCAGLLLAADLLILTGGNWVMSALVILLWVLPSPLWAWRRDVAASFYLTVWLALAWFVAVTFRNLFPLMPLKVGFSLFLLQIMLLSAPLLLAIAAAPMVSALRERAAWKLPALLVCPLVLLGSGAVVLRFGDVTKTPAYEMEWTPDLNRLASLTGTPLPSLQMLRSSALSQVNNEALVLLYRRIGNGYCIQPIFSDRLLAYLREHGRAQVRVTYSLRYSFGQYRGGEGVLSVDDYSMRQPGASDLGAEGNFAVGTGKDGTDCVH